MIKKENNLFAMWIQGILQGIVFAGGLLLTVWSCVSAFSNRMDNFGLLLLFIIGIVAGLAIVILTVIYACSHVNQVGCSILAVICFALAVLVAHYAHSTSKMWYQILAVALIAPGINFCRIGKLVMISLVANCCYLAMCGISFFYAMFLNTGEYMSMAMVAGVGCGILSLVCFTIQPITDNVHSESENVIVQVLGKFWRVIVGIFLIFVAVAPFAYSMFF